MILWLLSVVIVGLIPTFKVVQGDPLEKTSEWRNTAIVIVGSERKEPLNDFTDIPIRGIGNGRREA
jgi:hypothetical protein